MNDDFSDAVFIEADVSFTDDEDFSADTDETYRGDAHVARKEYGETALVALRCPLFILSAPNVPGCKATTTLGETTGAGWGLTLKLFGNGVEVGKKLTVSWSQSVSATPGHRNRIFLPLWAEVREVTLYFDDGREEEVRTEWTLRPDKRAPKPLGVDTLPPSAVRSEGVKLWEAPLKDYTDTEPVTRTFEYVAESSGSFSVGFSAFGDDQTLTIAADHARSQEVTAELVGGHDYVAMAGGWPLSLGWTVDGKAE